MELKPLNDRIVVTVTTTETKTASGIFIPDSAKDSPTTGVVVAAGPGVTAKDGTFVPVTVLAGNSIIFIKGGGHEVKVDGQEYTILKEEEILAVINKENA